MSKINGPFLLPVIPKTDSGQTGPVLGPVAPKTVIPTDITNIATQDPNADALKLLDDGKPKGDGTTPEGDPALSQDANLLRSLANTGPYTNTTRTSGSSGGFQDETKDVADEAGGNSDMDGKSTIGLGDHKFVNRDLGSTSKELVDGKWVDKQKTPGNNVNLNATLATASVSGKASVVHAEGKTQLADGVTAKGEVDVLSVEGRGTATIGADLKKGTIKGDLSGRVAANVVNVEGQIDADTALGRTTVKGKAFVGAEATGNVTVNIDPRKGDVSVGAGVDAFAGAKATAEINQEVKVGGHHIGSVGARGEAYAGIGVKAKANVGIEGGKVKAEFELGAALGVGVGAKINIEVDVAGTAAAVVDGAKKVGSAVADGARAVGGAISDGASAVANGAKSAWKKATSFFW